MGKVYATLKDNAVTYFSAKTMAFMRFDEKANGFSKVGEAQEYRTAPRK